MIIRIQESTKPTAAEPPGHYASLQPRGGEGDSSGTADPPGHYAALQPRGGEGDSSRTADSGHYASLQASK